MTCSRTSPRHLGDLHLTGILSWSYSWVVHKSLLLLCLSSFLHKVRYNAFLSLIFGVLLLPYHILNLSCKKRDQFTRVESQCNGQESVSLPKSMSFPNIDFHCTARIDYIFVPKQYMPQSSQCTSSTAILDYDFGK